MTIDRNETKVLLDALDCYIKKASGYYVASVNLRLDNIALYWRSKIDTAEDLKMRLYAGDEK